MDIEEYDSFFTSYIYTVVLTSQISFTLIGDFFFFLSNILFQIFLSLDLDGEILFKELKVIREVLTVESKSKLYDIEFFNYV